MRSLGLAAVLLGSVALAQLGAAEEQITATSFCAWSQSTVDVLIVPPGGPHAPYTEGGVSQVPGIQHEEPRAPWDGRHALAAGAAIDTWEEALHGLAAREPGRSHLAAIALTWTILGPAADQRIVGSPDVVVSFTPTQDAGGRTVQTCRPVDGGPVHSTGANTYSANVGTQIVMSSWLVNAFTPNDTYNMMLHEFGHALGLKHLEVEGDVMASRYPYAVGDLLTPQECLSNLNVIQTAAGFRWMDGLTPFQSPPPPTTMAASAYARPC